MPREIRVKELLRRYEDTWADASDWLVEARKISQYMCPGRGVFNRDNRPSKRTLSSTKIINNTASDAVSIFCAGLHGRLSGPSRHWFRIKIDDRAPNVDLLNRWFFDAQRRMHSAFHKSNLYEAIPGFYKEWAFFGNSSMFMHDDDEKYFKFNLMTFGEYVFTLKDNGDIDFFFRDIYMTARQLFMKFGEKKLPKDITDRVKDGKDDNQFYKVVQVVYERRILDKSYTSVYILVGNNNNKRSRAKEYDEPLLVSGFYEFPAPTARYDVIGSDTLGIGLGSEILSDTMRLQEMEKAFMMAAHKAVAPPMNVPSALRGTVQLRPNGINYVSATGQKIEPIENRAFDFQGVGLAAERVEKRIRKACFNDVFLSGMRDPNASPLKAAQVDRMEDEEIVKLGPAIGRLYSEALMPIVTRCFNSMLRRDMFAPIDPALLEAAGKFEIKLIGPLAQMQKLIEARAIQTFFSFVGGAIQFDESVKDAINVDTAIDEFADITGVPVTVINPQQVRDASRRQRALQAREQQQLQQAVTQQGLALESELKKSEIAKNYADAGQTQQESLMATGGVI